MKKGHKHKENLECIIMIERLFDKQIKEYNKSATKVKHLQSWGLEKKPNGDATQCQVVTKNHQ